jgi:hypothetical protein
VGAHIDMLEYMQMTSDAFNYLSKGDQAIIFPTYGSFLGSLGVLISKKNNEKPKVDSESESDENENQEVDSNKEEMDKEEMKSNGMDFSGLMEAPSFNLFGGQRKRTLSLDVTKRI